jgi:DNA-binding response OmpR family regulator
MGMKADDHSLQGARILIAEDDAILALDVREILRQAGAQIVGPAATLRQTLFLMSTFSVSAALLDVNLRDGEVFPAACALEERGAGIVFYTAYADVDSVRRAWPGARVLTKPAPPRLLISAIRQTCSPVPDEELHGMSAPTRSDLGTRTSGHRDRI